MRLTSPDSDTKRIFRDFYLYFYQFVGYITQEWVKMSYLCRCGKPIVVGSSRFGANPVGFATAFQQAVLRLPHPFDRFFHIYPQNGISIVTADDLRFFPHFRSNFPQSFPHIVENSCVKIRDHVVPPRKNILGSDISASQHTTYRPFHFVICAKSLFLSTFRGFFQHFPQNFIFKQGLPVFPHDFSTGCGKTMWKTV